MTIVGDDEGNELRIVPRRFRALQFARREFPPGRPSWPQVFTKRNRIRLECSAAAFCIEIPLIPVGADLLRRFAFPLKHQVRRGKSDQTKQPLWRENGDGVGRSGAPIVADQNETVNCEGVGEVEHILRQRRGLSAEGVRIFDAGVTKAAQVRNEETQALETIGKAYSGLTDSEIEELTEHFHKTTVRRRGRLHEVFPEVVLEVAFDSIQPSTRHSSGLALRFPRIKSIRHDKTISEIDTVEAAKQLVATSGVF